MKKLISGVLRFQRSAYAERRHLFEELAKGQSPEGLFLTCSDSRIDPNLVTQTEPGELFICRVAGNIVPPHIRQAGGITATIEYAVRVLGVRDIIICGHTDCGAMRAALNPDMLVGLDHVRDWLEYCRVAAEVVSAGDWPDEQSALRAMTEQNVLLQMQHIRTHPSVAVGLSQKQLSLHGWIYDIREGGIRCFDDAQQKFVAVSELYAAMLGEDAP